MMFIGFDISKDKVDLCWLRDPITNKKKTKVFKNNHLAFREIKQWLLSTTETIAEEIVITVEPTGVYHEPLMYFLYQQGFNIILANPSKAKKYAEALNVVHKTDRSDAIMLASYGYAKQSTVNFWQPEAKEIRELKALLRRLDALESNKQREQNRLEASEFNTASERVTQSLKETINFLDDEIKKLKSDIDSHINSFPDLKKNRTLLETIPGIGPVMSRELTYIFAAKNFSRAKQAAAYCGLIPRLHESGKMKGRTTMSKLGPSKIRSKLYMAAVVAGQWNYKIQQQKIALLNNGKTSMQIIGANMRKLIHICFGVIKNQEAFKLQES